MRSKLWQSKANSVFVPSTEKESEQKKLMHREDSFWVAEKGQAFEPFKMLIGAVMAMFVLAIIISAVTYFGELETSISQKRFFDGVKNAVNQPNGDVLVIQDLQFKKGTRYTSKSIGDLVGLPSECVEFIDNGLLNYEISPDLDLITLKQAVVTDVHIQCNSQEQCDESTICEVCCRISFEAEIEA